MNNYLLLITPHPGTKVKGFIKTNPARPWLQATSCVLNPTAHPGAKVKGFIKSDPACQRRHAALVFRVDDITPVEIASFKGMDESLCCCNIGCNGDVVNIAES